MSVHTQRFIARNTIIVAIIMGMSTVLGLIRESSVAYMFGAAYVTDAYLIALIIPNLIAGSVSASVTYTFISVYSGYLARGELDKALRMSNAVLTFLIVFLGVTLIIFIGFTPIFVHLIAPTYSGDQLSLTISLTRIIMPTLFFGGLVGVLVGINNSHHSFVAPASIGLVSNVIIIASIYLLGKTWGIYGLAAGVSIGSIAQLLLQIPAVRKHGFRFRLSFDYKNEGLHEVMLLLSPFIISAVAGQVNLIVDRTIATSLSPGAISALYFAYKLVFLPYGIITGALGTVIFPSLVYAATLTDWNKLTDVILKAIRLIILVLVPVIIELYVLRFQVVRILFQHGLFTSQDTFMTASIVPFFLGYLFFGVFVSVLVNLYFATKNMFFVVSTSVIAVLSNILLSLLLAHYMQQFGLALANSLSSLINFIFLIIGLFAVLKLHKKVKLNLFPLVKIGIQSVFAGLIIGIPISLLIPTIEQSLHGKLFETVISVTVALLGLLIYTAVIYLLGVEEVKPILDKILPKKLRLR